MTKYRTKAPFEAEQFNASKEQVKRYNIRLMPKALRAGYIDTLQGSLEVHVGDWIATGVDGEHWVIKDSIFRKNYEEAK